MSRVRPFVVPEGFLSSGRLELPADVGRHVRDVLRLRNGAPVRLSDGAGQIADGVVVTVDRRRVIVDLGPIESCSPPRGPAVILFQGVGKGDKLDSVVRQTVELGVREVQPVLTQRSVGKEVRVERLRAIAEDALRVSGRAWRPTIHPGRPLSEVMDHPRTGAGFVLALSASESLARLLPDAPPAIELLVGPEGGLTDDEVAHAVDASFRAAHLGPYTLRTETAGPAVVAVTMGLTGAWEKQCGPVFR